MYLCLLCVDAVRRLDMLWFYVGDLMLVYATMLVSVIADLLTSVLKKTRSHTEKVVSKMRGTARVTRASLNAFLDEVCITFRASRASFKEFCCTQLRIVPQHTTDNAHKKAANDGVLVSDEQLPRPQAGGATRPASAKLTRPSPAGARKPRAASRSQGTPVAINKYVAVTPLPALAPLTTPVSHSPSPYERPLAPPRCISPVRPPPSPRRQVASQPLIADFVATQRIDNTTEPDQAQSSQSRSLVSPRNQRISHDNAMSDKTGLLDIRCGDELKSSIADATISSSPLRAAITATPTAHSLAVVMESVLLDSSPFSRSTLTCSPPPDTFTTPTRHGALSVPCLQITPAIIDQDTNNSHQHQLVEDAPNANHSALTRDDQDTDSDVGAAATISASAVAAITSVSQDTDVDVVATSTMDATARSSAPRTTSFSPTTGVLRSVTQDTDISTSVPFDPDVAQTMDIASMLSEGATTDLANSNTNVVPPRSTTLPFKINAVPTSDEGEFSSLSAALPSECRPESLPAMQLASTTSPHVSVSTPHGRWPEFHYNSLTNPYSLNPSGIRHDVNYHAPPPPPITHRVSDTTAQASCVGSLYNASCPLDQQNAPAMWPQIPPANVYGHQTDDSALLYRLLASLGVLNSQTSDTHTASPMSESDRLALALENAASIHSHTQPERCQSHEDMLSQPPSFPSQGAPHHVNVADAAAFGKPPVCAQLMAPISPRVDNVLNVAAESSLFSWERDLLLGNSKHDKIMRNSRSFLSGPAQDPGTEHTLAADVDSCSAPPQNTATNSSSPRSKSSTRRSFAHHTFGVSSSVDVDASSVDVMRSPSPHNVSTGVDSKRQSKTLRLCESQSTVTRVDQSTSTNASAPLPHSLPVVSNEQIPRTRLDKKRKACGESSRPLFGHKVSHPSGRSLKMPRVHAPSLNHVPSPAVKCSANACRPRNSNEVDEQNSRVGKVSRMSSSTQSSTNSIDSNMRTLPAEQTRIPSEAASLASLVADQPMSLHRAACKRNLSFESKTPDPPTSDETASDRPPKMPRTRSHASTEVHIPSSVASCVNEAPSDAHESSEPQSNISTWRSQSALEPSREPASSTSPNRSPPHFGDSDSALSISAADYQVGQVPTASAASTFLDTLEERSAQRDTTSSIPPNKRQRTVRAHDVSSAHTLTVAEVHFLERIVHHSTTASAAGLILPEFKAVGSTAATPSNTAEDSSVQPPSTKRCRISSVHDVGEAVASEPEQALEPEQKEDDDSESDCDSDDQNDAASEEDAGDEDAGELRLTPANNDDMTDSPGRVCYPAVFAVCVAVALSFNIFLISFSFYFYA